KRDRPAARYQADRFALALCPAPHLTTGVLGDELDLECLQAHQDRKDPSTEVVGHCTLMGADRTGLGIDPGADRAVGTDEKIPWPQPRPARGMALQVDPTRPGLVVGATPGMLAADATERNDAEQLVLAPAESAAKVEGERPGVLAPNHRAAVDRLD